MSRVRKLTLQEWFLEHQLRHIRDSHVHYPLQMDVDVSHLVQAAEARGTELLPTPLVIKAAACLLREHPELNQLYMRTPMGARVLELDSVRVNLPVSLQHPDGDYLSGMVLDAPCDRSPESIAAEIRAFKATDPRTLPLGRVLVGGRNTLVNRTRLRVMHHLAYGQPRLYARFGGAISVSSVARRHASGSWLRGMAFGPTPLTLLLTAVERCEDGRTQLSLGVGYDHTIVPGSTFAAAMQTLSGVFRDERLLRGGVWDRGVCSTTATATATTQATTTATAT